MSKLNSFQISIWDPECEEIVPSFLGLLGLTLAGRAYTSEVFMWKHRDNPLGHSIICYAVSKNDGRLAGMRAFWACRLRRGKTFSMAFQPCETATHPDFQRMGLFSALTAVAIEKARERKAAVLFNFPNPNSKPGYLKLGWKDCGSLVTLIAPTLSARNLLRLAFGNCLPNGDLGPELTLTQIKDTQIMELLQVREGDWNDVWKGFRDLEVLKWRLKRPDIQYRVVGDDEGLIVVSIRNRKTLLEACLVEVILRDSETGVAIKRLLTALKERLRPHFITSIFTQGHPVIPLLHHEGFRSIRNRTNFTVRALCPDSNINNDCRWALSGLDIDTF